MATASLAPALLALALGASVAAAPIWRRRRAAPPDERAAADATGPASRLREAGAPAQRLRNGARVARLKAGGVVVRLHAAAGRAWRHRAAARWGPTAAAGLGCVAGIVVGPAAAAVLAAYGAAGFVLVRGAAVRRSQERAHRLAADAVAALAADLRAGLEIGPAWRVAEAALGRAQVAVLGGGRPLSGGVAVVAERVVAALTLAQACGAPLAEILDRLDAHLRAAERARSVAHSQAAGARVSAGLLAAMPVGGVGLGAVIGVDAARILLHTPLGVLALCLAVALQVGGLAWAARLAVIEVAL